ncbi:hypothetical protein SESBI_28097 [Sesbania bispinosa]|nr:hypothetical protein SESBI_28097 [Sesbania bispinosa]
MATEKDNAEKCFNTQDDSVETSSCIKHFENCHFGKALAYRAVYGSSGFQRRKGRNNDAKTTPSRLSKVSVAANNKDN